MLVTIKYNEKTKRRDIDVDIFGLLLLAAGVIYLTKWALE